MTLLRQLVIVIVTLFVMLFAGSVAINVSNTRSYLNNQLRSISQDMATSLGLSLSPHMAKGEMAVVESMINAVSDSGYYREVVLVDIEGKTLVERTLPIVIEGVPDWFVRLIPLDTPQGEALVMAGWQQAGTVKISANPGYAYATLWGNSIDAFWWFLGSSAFAFALGVLALHFVLRPLREVEAQAKAICDREYPVQKEIPWTLELRSVVNAMNLMSEKVKEMFKEQADAMERLRASTYVDSLTGLANREYFDLQLRQITKARSTSSTNALIFVEIDDFKQYNERQGFQAGDKLLQACAQLIRETCIMDANLDHFVARLRGGSFAVVIQDCVKIDAVGAAQRLAEALPQLYQRGLMDKTSVAHIGVAIHQGQAASQLLAQADMALRAAQVRGDNAVSVSETENDGAYAAYSASRWQETLHSVLDNGGIVLHWQPCLSCQDEARALQHEVLMRVYGDDGKLIPANVIIPMAKHLHLTREFDRAIVDMTLERLDQPLNADIRAAVNLFPMSIRDAGFIAWLIERLRQHPTAAARIAFEVPEHAVIDQMDVLRDWVRRVGELGARTGLDQVGKGFRSFDYLSDLKIDYLKVDGSFSRNLQENRENQLFIDALVQYAHGLDIEVIAESVETREEWDALKLLRVDAVKGYGVAKPSVWKP